MAAGNFQSCLAFVLKYEGGKSEDARDPGGRTNEGITEGTYSSWLKKKGRPDADVFAISAADRDAIYHEEFWVPISGDKLRTGEDLVVFDFAVNSGPHRALQVWREAGGSSAQAPTVIKDVCDKRLAFLKGLRTWQYFGAGWQKRVTACKATALKMAASPAVPAAPGPILTTTGAILTGAGGVISYLQTAPAGQALVLLLAGLGVLFTALFTRWKSEPPVTSAPSLPAPISIADELADLISQQNEIYAKIMIKEQQLKAEMADHQKLLDQIHPVILTTGPIPVGPPPPQG